MTKAIQLKTTIMTCIKLIIFGSIVFLFAFMWESIYRYDTEIIGIAFQKRGNWLIVALYAFLIFIFFNIYGGFKIGYYRIGEIVYSQCLSIGIINIISYIQISLISRKLIGPDPFLVLTLVQFLISIFLCCISNFIYFKLYPPRKMIIVYGRKTAASLVRKMSTRSDKYMICEAISIDEELSTILKRISSYESVIISDVPSPQRNIILKYCFENSIRTYLSPKISDIIIRGADSINLFDTPLLLCRNQAMTFEQRFAKRFIDIIVSFIGIILTSPFMLLTAIAIKMEDGGPVFFKQARCTLNSNIFNVIKFRSMIVDAEKDGKSRPATDNDPRITKVGNIIRKTRLDELPQLFNILKGDMSLIGPRPERIEHVEKYTEDIPEFKYRLKVKGGLTGYAQIFGKYNTTAYDKLKLDLMYIENYSLLLDFKILFNTVKIMFMKESTEGFDEKPKENNQDSNKDGNNDETNDSNSNSH